jgi:hypothetical protein
MPATGCSNSSFAVRTRASISWPIIWAKIGRPVGFSSMERRIHAFGRDSGWTRKYSVT